MLRERALQDDNENVRRAALSALVRGWLDPRVVYLMSRVQWWGTEFLDPREPIPADHISERSKQIGLDEAAARDLLASCEGVLGWNPPEKG